ncbi:MAG: hypothetical protein ABFR65_12965, partial [Pseudomonadota bacterium]
MERKKYFYRILAFTRLGGEVALIDKSDPAETIPLESWLGTVISLADGQHSIEELIDYLRGQYGSNVPAELERTVESVIERLIESQALMLSDESNVLPYHLSKPLEELDPNEAKLSMAEGGYPSMD